MKYKTIIADPPWGGEKWDRMDNKIRNHYPLMTIDQIKALPISGLADNDAVLLLWTTWNYLGDALSVVSSWGFDYQTGFPWVKLKDHPTVDMFGEFVARPAWGIGSWVRGCSEPVLIAKRGNVKPKKHWLGLLSKRMQHSRKPDNIYEYAESFDGPYLELFARRRRHGWHVWGNEVESDVQV